MNLYTKDFTETPAGNIVCTGHSYDPVTWDEIFLCAISVGRAGWKDVFHYGPDSILEMIYRYTIILANFRENGSLLHASHAFHNLDPSEKGAVSFFMGSTLAKLYGWKKLGAFWMMHLDVYSKPNPFCLPLPVSFNARGIRPDFIGQNAAGGWSVVEAKGRTNNIPKKLRETSKQQAKNIRTISGQSPANMYSLCASVGGDRVIGEWIDPPEPNPEGYNLTIDENMYILGCYSPVVNLLIHLGKAQWQTEDETIFVKLPNTELEIGEAARQI